MERLPDELLVLIARLVVDSSPSRAAYGLGSVSRRTRAIVKLALAAGHSTPTSAGSWLRVSGCASLVACLDSFRDAPSVSVEAQVTARTLAVALTRKTPTRLANLCVGAVISRSALDAARLMRALAKLELRSLDITMTITNGIGMLSSLRKLTIFASETRTLACVSRLTRLCDLELVSCHALVDVAHITSLVSLTRLAVSYCSRLIEVAPIGAVASLTDVSISSVSARIANIATLTSLGSLRHLRVRRALVSADTIARITTLESLAVQRTLLGSADVGPFTSLRRLATLEYDGDRFDGRRVVPRGLDGLVFLSVLRLIRCDVPDGLERVASLPRLTELHCSDIHQMRVARIHALTQLRALSFSRCHELADASAVSALVELRSLTVTSCASLRDLTHITGLVRLESVDISCDAPNDLAAFERLTNLRRLSVNVVSGIRGIRGADTLAALSSLTELRVGSVAALAEDRADSALVAFVSGTRIQSVLLNGYTDAELRERVARLSPASRPALSL